MFLLWLISTRIIFSSLVLLLIIRGWASLPSSISHLVVLVIESSKWRRSKFVAYASGFIIFELTLIELAGWLVEYFVTYLQVDWRGHRSVLVITECRRTLRTH